MFLYDKETATEASCTSVAAEQKYHPRKFGETQCARTFFPTTKGSAKDIVLVRFAPDKCNYRVYVILIARRHFPMLYITLRRHQCLVERYATVRKQVYESYLRSRRTENVHTAAFYTQQQSRRIIFSGLRSSQSVFSRKRISRLFRTDRREHQRRHPSKRPSQGPYLIIVIADGSVDFRAGTPFDSTIPFVFLRIRIKYRIIVIRGRVIINPLLI